MKLGPMVSMGIAASALAYAVSAFASPHCRGCDIVAEGVFGPALVGQTVWLRGKQRWHPVQVERIDPNPPAIYWRGASGNSGWDDARSYYSETAYREVTATTGGGTGANDGDWLNPIDRESRDRLWQVCYAYMAARDRARSAGEQFGSWWMRRGCCESSDAKRFGTPHNACGAQ